MQICIDQLLRLEYMIIIVNLERGKTVSVVVPLSLM
jgi:hypothetical protein